MSASIKAWALLALLLVGALAGCASSDVTTDDVKSKEAQIDNATNKLPTSNTHSEGDERERGN